MARLCKGDGRLSTNSASFFFLFFFFVFYNQRLKPPKWNKGYETAKKTKSLAAPGFEATVGIPAPPKIVSFGGFASFVPFDQVYGSLICIFSNTKDRRSRECACATFCSSTGWRKRNTKLEFYQTALFCPFYLHGMDMRFIRRYSHKFASSVSLCCRSREYIHTNFGDKSRMQARRLAVVRCHCCNLLVHFVYNCRTSYPTHSRNTSSSGSRCGENI